VEVQNFGSSEFCKPCHQFGPDDNRVAGKLLEDTYDQWKQSRYAKEGVRCADCHMPDRRHLWQGIHDPEMVKQGVTIQAERNRLDFKVAVANTGVGHLFPTYVTPQVVLKAQWIVEGQVEKEFSRWIGWYVELNLSGERFDTRIPPDQSLTTLFRLPEKANKGVFRVTLTVYPDEFYYRFFKSLIKNPPDGVDLKQIKEAFDETSRSSFTLFEKSWYLSGG
jgi:hypothetical protein